MKSILTLRFVKGDGDGILLGPICSLRKLVGVEGGGQTVSDVLRHYLFETLHDYRREGEIKDDKE